LFGKAEIGQSDIPVHVMAEGDGINLEHFTGETGPIQNETS
jgi:hypothetical protein